MPTGFSIQRRNAPFGLDLSGRSFIAEMSGNHNQIAGIAPSRSSTEETRPGSPAAAQMAQDPDLLTPDPMTTGLVGRRLSSSQQKKPSLGRLHRCTSSTGRRHALGVPNPIF